MPHPAWMTSGFVWFNTQLVKNRPCSGIAIKRYIVIVCHCNIAINRTHLTEAQGCFEAQDIDQTHALVESLVLQSLIHDKIATSCQCGRWQLMS